MTIVETGAAVDQRALRRAWARYPTGVCVISALDQGKPVGLTVSSLVSASLEPAMLGFLPDKSSTSWPRVQRCGAFSVNVLSEDQEEVCASLSVSGGAKFVGVDWAEEDGLPRIGGVASWFSCSLAGVLDAGDHWFVLGGVTGFWADESKRPLVYYGGSYSTWRVSKRKQR